jgi:hypothetical protein
VVSLHRTNLIAPLNPRANPPDKQEQISRAISNRKNDMNELQLGGFFVFLSITLHTRREDFFQLPIRKALEDGLTYAIALPKCCNDVVRA